MGLDISAIFGSAKQAAETGMNDLLKLGGAAALGYIEDQAMKALAEDKARNEAIFKTKAEEILKRPTAANSLGGYVSDLVESPLAKTYAPYVLGVAAVVAIGMIFLSKGK